MTDWTRRTNFFTVDDGIVDEIGVYDVTKDRVGDSYAASVYGFNGKRATHNVIPAFEDYAVEDSVMTFYLNVPLDLVTAYLDRWEVAPVQKIRGQKAS